MFSTALWRCAALGAAVSLLVATGQSARSAPAEKSGRSTSAASAGRADADSFAKPPRTEPKVPFRPPLSANEKKVEATLRKPTQMEFVETPLEDVFNFLKQYHGIDIQLDKKALDEANVGSDTPITRNLKGIPLASALNLMLREIDLTWIISNDVLLITTQENADARLTTRLYDVGDLVVCRDRNKGLWYDYQTLIDLLTAMVAPTTWDPVGGPASIGGSTLGNAKIITVSTTYEVHCQIVQFLADIRAIAKENPKSEPPQRDRPKGKKHGRAKAKEGKQHQTQE
jgi:hypothetical protein